MALTRYRKINTTNLTKQQEIIAGGRFKVVLDVIGDEPIGLLSWAGRLDKWGSQNDYPMLDEHSFGYAVLRLVEEGLVEMTNNGPCKEDCCDDLDYSNITQIDASVNFKRLHPDAQFPKYATDGSVGADVYSAEDVTLLPGDIKLIALGFSIEIPPGMEIQVRSRSGLSLKGVVVVNSPGTIDSDFRDECQVILSYIGKNQDGFKINKGDRIAQFVLAPVKRAYYNEVSELSVSTRAGGFGSTGLQ